MENKDIIRKTLPLALIDPNDGQVEGLPRNPREWTYTDMEHLKASIEQTPKLLEAKGIIVYPYQGRYVVVGGNMRVAALRSLGRENAPCVIWPEDSSIEELREVAIKDNGSFGEWDEQLLLDDWNGTPFDEWGIRFFEDAHEEEPSEKESHAAADDGKEVFEVEFEAGEFDYVNSRLRDVNDVPEQALLTLINNAEQGKESEDGRA